MSEYPAFGALAIPASEIERKKVEWLWRGRVPLGQTTLLVGREGLGKSMLTCWLAAKVSRGELGPPGVVLLASAEDSLATTVRPRLEALEADLDLVRFLRMRTDGIETDLCFPADLDELRDLVGVITPRLVVIDPLMAHLQGAVDTHRDQDVRFTLAPLHHLAEEHGCALVPLLHLNKTNSHDALQRIGGSVGFAALARSVLLLARDPADPGGEHGTQRVLAHIKCNVAPLAESLLYEIEPILIPASGSQPEVETARITQVGVCNYTGSELLRGPEPSSKLDEAEAFLREQLADGPRNSAEVKEAAQADGISDKTLRKARERLRVEYAREAFSGLTTWWLPDVRAPSCPPPAPGHERCGGHERTDRQSPLPAVSVPVRAPEVTDVRALVPLPPHASTNAREDGPTPEEVAEVIADFPEWASASAEEQRTFATNLLATERRLGRRAPERLSERLRAGDDQ